MNQGHPPRRPPGRKGPSPKEAVSWKKVRAVFAAGLDVPPEQRPAWLAGLPGLDEPLRREVASLLEAHERAGGFLDPEGVPRAEVLHEHKKKGSRRPR